MDQRNLGKEEKPFYKKWWFWVLVVLVVILLPGMLSGDPKDDKQNDIGKEQTQNPTLGAEEPQDTDDLDVIEDTDDDDIATGPIEEIVEDNIADKEMSRNNSQAVQTTLNAGKFEVGTDIPEGRYVITGDGNGNLFIYDENDVPYINEILGGGEIGVDSVTTDIKTGDKIEISGINKVTFVPAETIMYKDSLTTGNWVVGLDIAPGRYDITSADGSGNLFIYNTTGWIEVNEILGNEDFGVEKVTTELKDGYIISISGMNKVNFDLK